MAVLGYGMGQPLSKSAMRSGCHHLPYSKSAPRRSPGSLPVWEGGEGAVCSGVLFASFVLDAAHYRYDVLLLVLILNLGFWYIPRTFSRDPLRHPIPGKITPPPTLPSPRNFCQAHLAGRQDDFGEPGIRKRSVQKSGRTLLRRFPDERVD